MKQQFRSFEKSFPDDYLCIPIENARSCSGFFAKCFLDGYIAGNQN